jgi:DNA-binding transcriptional LysR family regulator
VLTQSDLLAVLPASFVAASAPGEVVAKPLPVEIGPLTVDMVWLARRDADPAHQWLRDRIAGAARFS